MLPEYTKPYFYVLDFDAIPDGTNLNNYALPTFDFCDFYLRRVAGWNFVKAPTGRLQIYGPDQNKFFFSPIQNIVRDFPVIPQMKYQTNSSIVIDNSNVLRANNAYTGVPGSVPNYFSQLCFQGIRQYITPVANRGGYSNFREKPYTYTFRLENYTKTGRVGPAFQVLDLPDTYTVRIDNYDFVWDATIISVRLLGGESVFQGWQASEGNFKLTFYDLQNVAYSNAPVLDVFYNTSARNNVSCFPIPSLVFPVGSDIKFDLWSLLTNGRAPAFLEITFIGRNRIPC